MIPANLLRSIGYHDNSLMVNHFLNKGWVCRERDSRVSESKGSVICTPPDHGDMMTFATSENYKGQKMLGIISSKHIHENDLPLPEPPTRDYIHDTKIDLRMINLEGRELIVPDYLDKRNVHVTEYKPDGRLAVIIDRKSVKLDVHRED